MTLENEAKEYSLKVDYSWSGITQASAEGFIAGANSNYAKQQVIKGKIEVLMELMPTDLDIQRHAYADFLKFNLESKIAELKQLETPKS